MNTSTNSVATGGSFIPVETQIWDNGRHAVRCVKTIQETWDTKTFCFMAHQPTMFFFKPGQFVTLELEIDVITSYSIHYTKLYDPLLTHLIYFQHLDLFLFVLHQHMQSNPK